MPTNKLRGETLVTLAGKEYKARLTMNSIMTLEASVGMGVLKLAQKMGEGDIMLSHIIKVLTPALRGGGNDVQEKDVINLVQEAGLVNATRAVAELLAASLTDSNSEEAEEGGKPAEEE